MTESDAGESARLERRGDSVTSNVRRRTPRLRLLATLAIMVLAACLLNLYLRLSIEPVDVAFLPPEGGHVMYLPTPQDVVVKMLELAEVSPDDLVYDLGCGDGRVVVTAALRYGCRGRGYDIDPLRVRDSRANVEQNGVGHLVAIERKDVFQVDLSKADVVFLYLLPELNVRLIPQLQKLRPGSRIISHMWDMKGVQPDKVLHLESSHDNQDHVVYLWTTPLRVAEAE
jgi:precorrin-6B methylase 2